MESLWGALGGRGKGVDVDAVVVVVGRDFEGRGWLESGVERLRQEKSLGSSLIPAMVDRDCANLQMMRRITG